jgi:hypothetical protein
MKELLLIAVATAAALGVVAASVLVARDTTTLASPPETVAEEFVRQLATGRYDRALKHLAEPTGALQAMTSQGQALRARAGAIDLVEGEGGAIMGDSATASTRIKTSRAGELHARFDLVRQRGVWKISRAAFEF